MTVFFPVLTCDTERRKCHLQFVAKSDSRCLHRHSPSEEEEEGNGRRGRRFSSAIGNNGGDLKTPHARARGQTQRETIPTHTYLRNYPVRKTSHPYATHLQQCRTRMSPYTLIIRLYEVLTGSLPDAAASY